MDNKQKKHSRIVEAFTQEICRDLFMAFLALIYIIVVPLGLATIFTPDLIAKEGYLTTWSYWIFAIILVVAFSMLIYGLVDLWIDSRWRKAKEKVENENGRK